MLRKILLIAASSVAFVSTASQAQPIDDVRCLLLSNAFAQSGSTADAKKAGQSGAMFYLGRIDGRWTDGQLRAAIARHQKSMTSNKATAEMRVCMQRLDGSYKKLQSIAPPPAQKR